jgi:ketosteroid isomerase-like protein
MKRAAVLLALALAALAHAGEPATAREATADLYARMSAGDLPGVARYVPAEGFTELDAEAVAPHRIDAAAFAGLFKSGAQVAFRTSDVQEQVLGDVVVVTGLRIGAIGPAPEAATPFTMVWQRDGGGWKLRHVHLSKAAPGH